MSKCRLCQQIYNNLTIIYNNRLKSLTQIILKLKGFKGPWDTNKDLAVCESCIKGVENVALFWENIPEAKIESSVLPDEFNKQTAAAPYRMEPNLPALMLETKSESDHNSSTRAEEKLEPIKLHIKLPRKRKRKEPGNTSNVIEPLQKRTRRCPQRFDDFQLTANNNNVSALKEESSIRMQDLDADNKIAFNDLPQIALLRLENSQHIGTLAEVESKGLACKIRISCEICGQMFRFEKLFQKHLKTHFPTDLLQTENFIYHCKLCDKPFSNHRAVRKHLKLAHTEERNFKCCHCETSFKYKFNLNYHISTKHIPQKHFECTFCKKRFLMRYELQIHVRTHTKERPYKCELCSFAFAHKSNLKTHQRIKHFENSTDIENCKKSTILTTQFIPPANLIEREDKSNFEESDVSNEKLEFTENFSNEENGFQRDSVDCQQFNISSEEIKLPEALLEQEKTPNSDFNDRNISDLEILTNFENLVENLKDNFETSATKTMFKHNSNIKLDSTEQPNLESTKILEITTTNESSEGFLKSPPILGVFHVDSSLLKVLPSTNILGLKKWPKSFQSTPKNHLQLVKSSTFCHNHNADKFEIIKTLENLQHKMEITAENSLNSTNSFIISPQLADNNTFSNWPSTVSDSNFSKLNITTTNVDVLEAKSDQIINISQPTESLSSKQEQHKFGYEISSNISYSKMSLESKAAQPWKDIKVSGKPVKVKYITNSTKQSSKTSVKNSSSIITKAANENFTSKEISATNTPPLSHNLQPNIGLTNTSLKPFKISSQSLLKPLAKEPPATSLSFTSTSLNRTLLHDKPLITNIEILPPLKNLTTLQNSSTTASLIKPPVEYKFQCCYCYKYFKQKSPLTKHLRTHTGEKPYKCNLCPKSYADASNYKKHKILHKNAAEALNISRTTTSYAVQSSPAYSTVSDPDPDGIEVMQTLKKFECSSTEDDGDDDIDENDSDSSNIESQMWHDALDQALNSQEIRENLRINLMGLNNAILPKTMQFNKKFSTDLD